MLMAHLNGHAFATTGTGPYTHVLQLGRDLSAGTTTPQTYGISMVVNREGVNSATGAEAFVYSGLKPTAVDLAFARGTIATANWEVVGKDSATISIPTESLSTVPYCVAPSAGTGTLVKSIQYGVDASEIGYNVRAMGARIEQPVFERRTLEDATQLIPLPNGDYKITGSFEIEAPDINTGSDTFDVFIDAYRAVTMNSLILTAEGPEISGGTNNSLTLDIPKVRITNVGEPWVADSGVVVRTVEWESAYSGTAAIGHGTLTLINNEALAYTAGV